MSSRGEIKDADKNRAVHPARKDDSKFENVFEYFDLNISYAVKYITVLGKAIVSVAGRPAHNVEGPSVRARWTIARNVFFSLTGHRVYQG